MFKTSALLFCLSFFATAPTAFAGDKVGLDEIGVKQAVPSAALNFEVNLNLRNFNAQQEDKLLEAADLIKKVVASEEFKNAILNHKYRGKRQFVDNRGLSNRQIYKRILEGAEKLSKRVDNEMDLDLTIYRAQNNVVGYTYPNTKRIWMNSRFLNQNTPAKVTTNMMHEWLHKLGFDHDRKPTARRPHSVPYAVGYLVARLAKQHS
jgi:hypothetical protein